MCGFRLKPNTRILYILRFSRYSVFFFYEIIIEYPANKSGEIPIIPITRPNTSRATKDTRVHAVPKVRQYTINITRRPFVVNAFFILPPPPRIQEFPLRNYRPLCTSATRRVVPARRSNNISILFTITDDHFENDHALR